MSVDGPLAAILANATTEELRVIAAVMQRANARPAIVVTVREGRRQRRYVVAQEDEALFEGLADGPVSREHPWDGPQFPFGGRWLRGYGRVDEMYRSLCGWEITRIARVDRNRVWGTDAGA